MCVILAPRTTVFENDPRVFVESYVDKDLDLNTTLRWSAIYAGDNAEFNRKKIDLVIWVYLVAVVALGCLVGAFAVALL